MPKSDRHDCGAAPSARPDGARPRLEAFSRYDMCGGGERDRTDDLLLAKQALSQLSYAPQGAVAHQQPG
jgi:hypothetical protein